MTSQNIYAWWLKFDTCENYLYNEGEDKNISKPIVESNANLLENINAFLDIE